MPKPKRKSVPKAEVTTFAELVDKRGVVPYSTAYARAETWQEKGLKVMDIVKTPAHQRPGNLVIPGAKIEGLLIDERVENGPGREARYAYTCQCGNKGIAFKKNILAKRTKSCGKCGYESPAPVKKKKRAAK